MGAPGKKLIDYRKEQLVRMDVLAPLYKRGYSFREMRAEVMARLDLPTYSTRTVAKDIKRLLAEWQEERLQNIDDAVQLELKRIDDIIQEAWEAWDKSKTDYERKKAKQQSIPEGVASDSGFKPVKLDSHKEEVISFGDPRYLDVINKQAIERRKLLGLYAPEQKDVKVTEYNLNNLSEEQKATLLEIGQKVLNEGSK